MHNVLPRKKYTPLRVSYLNPHVSPHRFKILTPKQQDVTKNQCSSLFSNTNHQQILDTY